MAKSHMKKTFTLLLLSFVIVGLLGLSSCSMMQNSSSLSSSHSQIKGSSYNEFDLLHSNNLNLKTFDNEDEFENLFSTNTNYGGGYYRGMDTGVIMKGEVMPTVAMDTAVGADIPSSETGSSNTVEDDFSQTNNQVEGVDEADILKTDGEYIYTISGNNLHIIKAYPGDNASVLSTITFDQRPQGIFIDGNKLAVFGTFYDKKYFDKMGFKPRNGMTYFTIYNITNKSNPVVEKELKLEGSYLEARMIGDYVYFVVRNTPTVVGPYPLPVIMNGDKMSMMKLDQIHYFNIPYSYPQLVTAHAISLTEGKVTDSQGVVIDNSQSIYMSENNLYIMSGQHINEWDIRKQITKNLVTPLLTKDDKDLIQRIKNVEDAILSQGEKEQKIMNVYYNFISAMSPDDQDTFNEKLDSEVEDALDKINYFDYTIVNKIKANKGKLSFEATGKVPGNTINQFSFDEFKGNLRIATTIPQRWSSYAKNRTESYNNVFVMDKDLKIVGNLTGLAKGEQIYSTRFMGDRLYMVTFKQVDPFFAFDLSNPKKPKLLGKLKLPGFSRYLHPYDENHIIGIGQDTTESGRTSGLKISLFDVTDVEHPLEVAKFVTDEKYARSTALYEHKAFLFNKEKELMVIPVYNKDYSWRNEGSEQEYNGAFVFKITPDEIILRGLIDHSMAKGEYYGPAVERSLFINDLLYTKSRSLLRINSLDDLHSVKNITLSTKENTIPVY